MRNRYHNLSSWITIGTPLWFHGMSPDITITWQKKSYVLFIYLPGFALLETYIAPKNGGFQWESPEMFSPAGKPVFAPEPAPWPPRERRAVAVDPSQPARFSRTSCSVSDKKKVEKNETKKNITVSEFCEFQFNQPKRLVFFELRFKFLESDFCQFPLNVHLKWSLITA